MRVFLILICYCSFNVMAQPPNYELVWADEFDGNGAIDGSKWHHQTILPNGDSWYNGEIQHYTDRTVNSYVSDGTLKIVAKKETFSDQGVTKTHTSARLNSKFAFTYGFVSIRAKLPTGIGTWPAMWTLGQNIIETGGYWSDTNGTVIWPACGEIDIMEHWGTNQDYVQSAIHSPSSFGNTINKGGQVIPNVSEEFRDYTMEWTPEQIIFKVNGITHYIYNPDVQNSDTWPFDANQYILLNVAILPEIMSSFTESALEIDYVRVYQEATLSIQDQEFKDQIKLYPNPVIDTLSINLPLEVIEGIVTIYDGTGKRINSHSVKSNNLTIDISTIPSGIYFVEFVVGNRKISKRFIKK